MLPESINNSISDRRKHLSREEVKALFLQSDPDPIQRYAIDIMFSEAMLQEIVDFLMEDRIPMDQAKRLYARYRLHHPTRKSDKYEWFFGPVP